MLCSFGTENTDTTASVILPLDRWPTIVTRITLIGNIFYPSFPISLRRWKNNLNIRKDPEEEMEKGMTPSSPVECGRKWREGVAGVEAEVGVAEEGGAGEGDASALWWQYCTAVTDVTII